MSQKVFAVAAAGVALVLALAGCSGGSSGGNSGGNQSSGSVASTSASAGSTATPTGTATSGATAASAEIEQNWVAFFDGKTPAQQKVALLQNGQQFAQLIQQQSGSPLAQQTSAQVSDVSLTDPHTARVTYTILLGGQPALKDQAGTALLIDGTWKVSDQSFCALLSLQGAAPPQCPAASASPSS